MPSVTDEQTVIAPAAVDLTITSATEPPRALATTTTSSSGPGGVPYPVLWGLAVLCGIGVTAAVLRVDRNWSEP